MSMALDIACLLDPASIMSAVELEADRWQTEVLV